MKPQLACDPLFDGFRTSHEVAKIDMLSDDDLSAPFPKERGAWQV